MAEGSGTGASMTAEAPVHPRWASRRGRAEADPRCGLDEGATGPVPAAGQLRGIPLGRTSRFWAAMRNGAFGAP